MPSPRTLRLRAAMPTLRPDITYSAFQLKANPLTETYAVSFEGMLVKWNTTYATLLGFNDAIAEAQARIDSCDVRLDFLAGRIFKVAMTLVHDKRGHSLVTRYFGDTSLSDFRKPVLGSQLAEMRGWIPSLKASEHASLKELGIELEALVAEADIALTTKAQVEQQKKDFNDIGDRKKFVDELNALRKFTYGELAKLAHETLGLPMNFPDQFFRRESRDDGDAGEDEPTLETAKARVATLENELVLQKKLVLDLEAEHAKAAEAEAAAAAEEALLKDLEKMAEEAALKVKRQREKLKLAKK